jgi:hypothetical protein
MGNTAPDPCLAYYQWPVPPPAIIQVPPPAPTSTVETKTGSNYLLFSFVATMVILMILWIKNPSFVQQTSDDPLIQQPTSCTKLLLLGVAFLCFFLLGPSIWKHIKL